MNTPYPIMPYISKWNRDALYFNKKTIMAKKLFIIMQMDSVSNNLKLVF